MSAQNFGCGEWGIRHLTERAQYELTQSLGLPVLELGFSTNIDSSLPSALSDEAAGRHRDLQAEFSVRTPFAAIETELTHEDSAALRNTLSQLKTLLEQLPALGIEIVTLQATARPTIDTETNHSDQLVTHLTELATIAQPLGLRIAVATRGSLESQQDQARVYAETVFTQRSTLTNLLEALPDRVGITYEPGMVKAVCPNDWRFLVDLVKDRTLLISCHDWRSENRALIPAPIGDDDLDYRPLIKEFASEIPILLQASTPEEPAPGIQRARTYLQHLTEES